MKVGTVQNLSGKFYVKDENGNVVELKNGDVVKEGMVIIGDKGNPASAKVQIIDQDSGEPVVVSGTDEQALDATFLDSFKSESESANVTELSQNGFSKGNSNQENSNQDSSNHNDFSQENNKPTQSISSNDYFDSTENTSDYDISEDIVKSEDDSVDNTSYDNQVMFDDDLENNSNVSTGSTNDKIIVDGDVEDNSMIETGSGNDKVIVDDVENSSILNTGSGNDEVNMEDVQGSTTIKLGSGDDKLVIGDDIDISSLNIDGGSGIDELVLENKTQDDWDDGLKDQFTNFENVTFSDGTTLDLTENDSSNNDSGTVEPPVIKTITDMTENTDLTITGIANAGETVTLYNGNEVLGTVNVDDNGHWLFVDSDSVLISDPEDSSAQQFSLTATAMDINGNVSDVSEVKSFVTNSGDSVSETIIATDGADTIFAGDGDDIVDAGAGNDVVDGGAGADTLDGGDGFDILSYEKSTEGVNVNLSTNESTGGDAEGDTIENFERIDGSNFDDVLIGNDDSFNYLIGNGGNDTLIANGGNNFLSGGSGDDTIEGGDGRDTIVGGAGADILDGAGGFNSVVYTDSNASVNVNLDTNEVSGGYADGDVIQNFDRVNGSHFNDILTGNDDHNVLAGDNGNDILIGAGGDDYIYGGNGTDIATYSGNFEDYTTEIQENGELKVIDSRVDMDGTDTLTSIETLQFADGIYDVANGIFTSSNIDEAENLHVRNIEYHSDIENSTDYDDYIESGLTTGNADDTIIVEDDISGDRIVDTGSGDDILAVGGDIQHGAIVNTGDGDDNIIIGDSNYLDLDLDSSSSIEDNSIVNTGTGDDSLSANLLSDSSVNMGSGDDSLVLNRIAGDSTIDTGTGNDEVVLNDVSSGFDNGSVDLGDGNDSLTIDDTLAGTDAIFNGGEGEDTLVLENVNRDDWDNDIKENFVNFEHVVLNGTGSELDEIDSDNVFDVNDGTDFDFSDDNLDGFDNLQAIDMDNGSENSIEGITLDDILEMTDDNNTLTIAGDDSDSLDINTDGWTQNGATITDTNNGMTTYEYSNSSGDIITLNIDEQIHSTGM